MSTPTILENGIEMGFRSYGNPTRRGNANKITVGKYTSIAEGVILDGGYNHIYTNVSTYPFHMWSSEYISNIELPRDTTIGSDCWIGEGVLILAGAKVSDGAVIGARSMVTKNTYIGPYEIWAGTPARKIKHRFDHMNLNKHDRHHLEITRKLLQLKWWDLDENKVREIIPLLLSDDFEKLFKLFNL